jgi:hypothetical protein
VERARGRHRQRRGRLQCTIELVHDRRQLHLQLSASTGGGIIANGAPTGTHCARAALGAADKSYSFEGLKDSIVVSAPQLEKKGSLSKPVSAQNSENCGSTTCDQANCSNDLTTAAAVPTTCSNQQSYMGKLKVTLVK